MDITPRWALPLLFAGQAQKEIFHNEALGTIDALLHGWALSADVASPPADPAIGQCWIVAAGATGVWAGQGDAIACWTQGGWRFIAPMAGMRIAVADRGHALHHDGDQWRDAPVRADGLFIHDDQVVGPRQSAISTPVGGTTIDAEARNAIANILAALRTHGLIHV